MKPWHRIGAFLTCLSLFALGKSSLEKRYDYAFLFATVKDSSCQNLPEEILKGFDQRNGYWKDIYKAYHMVAYIEYRKGNSIKAKMYLKKCLHYHPFYPNGYKMYAFLLGRNTSKGRACYQVYETIMKQGMIFELVQISKCLNDKNAWLFP